MVHFKALSETPRHFESNQINCPQENCASPNVWLIFGYNSQMLEGASFICLKQMSSSYTISE